MLRAEEGRFQEVPCPWELSCAQLRVVEDRLMHLAIPTYLDVAYKYTLYDSNPMIGSRFAYNVSGMFTYRCDYVHRLHARDYSSIA